MNNKFLSIAASTAIVASALVFSGCGDSSSSTTTPPSGGGNTPTTLSGTAVKGPWSNVTYTVTANGTMANTTGTLTAGAFTFGTTLDNVTIELGLAKWKMVNPASGSMFNFINAAQEGTKLVRANGTEYSAADYANVIDNLLLTTLTFENDTAALESTTTPYNAGSLIANFAKLAVTGLDLTQNSATFQTSLATNLTAANLTSVNKTSVATAATNMLGYKAAIRSAYGTALAAAYASKNSLNNTMLNNTIIIVSNSTGKYAIDLTNTANVGGVPANGNISAGGQILKPLGSCPINATGSVITFGSTNTSNLTGNYSVFTAPLSDLKTGGVVKMRYVDASGEMKEFTVNAIRTNLSSWGGTGYTLNKNQNITLTDSYGNPKLRINLSGAGNGAVASRFAYANISAYTASTDSWAPVNNTLGGNATANITDEAGMAGLPTTLSLWNKSTADAIAADGAYMNLTFDFDPVGYQNGGNGTFVNGGVIATIVNAVDSALLAISKFFLSVFKVAI